MIEEQKTIGIIAGGGQFPLMVAEAAGRHGLRVVAVAHQGETDPSITDCVDSTFWIKLGQLGRLLKAFKANGVDKAVMAGTITKRRMFGDIRPDLKGLSLISKMAVLHDDGILRAVADELAKEGIQVISAAHFLPELIAPVGTLTKKKPNKAEKEDILLGWRIAKELGRLDIGQCVVVRDKTVLALEAIEGTNETIKRGGNLAGKNAVVVKISKPNQDLRFDMPSVGPETIRTMVQVKASVLALEAGKTLIFERSEMIKTADKMGISIVSYEDSIIKVQ
ncbi:MAG: UDP-2,3-diacylglucosamine diphosphatase LpxI [Deltaproteobacteria bacterium]|nr:UDP-2,3-diacylglucosamine diphosphatase LpxI [Deltaproteobacteria bacterium]